MDAWHDDASTLARLSENAIAAFTSTLDVELHPRGVADAFLRELAYVLTDLPTAIALPPPHVLPPGMRDWPNMSAYRWMWDPMPGEPRDSKAPQSSSKAPKSAPRMAPSLRARPQPRGHG